MKILNLIPATFLVLSACTSGTNSPKAPAEPQVIETVTTTYGPSSDVEFHILSDEESPALPEQIRANIEQPRLPNAEHVRVFSHDFRYYTASEDSITFGCDSDPAPDVLPQHIEANTVILCGAITIPEDFKMYANSLVLQDATLTTGAAPTADNMRYVNINAKEIHLIGENHLKLIGKKDGENVEFAPSAFVTTNGVTGVGTLEVFSARSIHVEKTIN